jgi:hypothetical protein
MNFVTPYEAFLAVYDQAVAGENDFDPIEEVR